jgi:rod shape-determining protein MreD
MIRFSYYIATIIMGLVIQTIGLRYLTVYGIGPNVLLLLVVAHGFFYGPLIGELFGFSFGLIADSMGSSLFGMHSLLLTLAGYVTGRLRRRVASERPTGQFVIALTATILYGIGASIIGSWFEPGVHRVPILSVVGSAIFNALVMPVVFAALEQWSVLWQENREHLL